MLQIFLILPLALWVAVVNGTYNKWIKVSLIRRQCTIFNCPPTDLKEKLVFKYLFSRSETDAKVNGTKTISQKSRYPGSLRQTTPPTQHTPAF
jgi:hypothetical protein